MKLFKRKQKPYKCPYDHKSCGYIDDLITLGHSHVESCTDCERYGQGIHLNNGCAGDAIAIAVMIICLIGATITSILAQ